VTVLACWLAFPAVLTALSLGCGLLADRAAGERIPGMLLLPTGLAVIVVAAQFAVATDATAELAPAATVVLALLGFALSRSRWRVRPDRWAVAAAAAVLAAFGAPILLYGAATFAGYLRLDDTTVWFAITDHVMEHGRGLGSLAPSSYEAVLHGYLSSGYPIGAFLPLGVGRALVGQDVAWVFQPYLAFIAAMLALVLYHLVSPVIESRSLRAFVVFIAAQPAILFGFTLIGGVKEVLAAMLLALVPALALPAALTAARVRALLPLALVTAAIVSVLSYGSALWILSPLAVALALAVGRLGRSVAIWRGVAFISLASALALPSLPALGDFLGSASDTLTSGGELGALPKPLSLLQVFGIWPVGDFRASPDDFFITRLLVTLVIVAGLGGAAFAFSRRRAWALVLYVGASAVGCLAVATFGAPWVDAKAFAIASPALLLVGLIGAVAALRPAPIAGGLAVLAIAFGVVWSNVLAYHDVNLAPRDRLAELEQIGGRIDGKGPTLITLYELYGSRHFLRRGDPEGSSELSPHRVVLLNGKTLNEGEFQDIDGFRLDSVLTYRSLVLPRSPTASRPPSPYRLTWRGRFYELWQREEHSSSRIIEHLPLGNVRDPIARPHCSEVMRLARLPGTKRLATARQPQASLISLSAFPHPAGWQPDPRDPGILFPYEGGRMSLALNFAAGRYEFWIGSAFRRRLELSVSGQRIGARTHELQLSGQFVPMGSISVPAGFHDVVIDYGDAGLHPGSGGLPFPFGPLAVSRGTAERPLTYLRPSAARSLCGERLDWVEALGAD
jgi:hypothetical protein